MKFSILTLPVGLLKTNCYLFFETKTRDTLIIDPGGDADFCIDVIMKHELHPRAIMATHGHFDHILAAGTLQDTFHIPFYIHEDDVFLMKRLRETAEHFLGYNIIEYPPRHVITYAFHSMSFANTNITVMQTPGHTPGSVSLIEKSTSSAFVGDLLFADGSVGSTDKTYSSTEKLLMSIRKILQLSDETIIYPGHGMHTSVKRERKIRKALFV